MFNKVLSKNRKSNGMNFKQQHLHQFKLNWQTKSPVINHLNWQSDLYYLNKNYKVLCAEQEFIIHPAAFGMLPISAEALKCSFTCSFLLKEYHLMLDKLTMMKVTSPASEQEGLVAPYEGKELTVFFNGAVLIGADFVGEYNLKDNVIPYFSYQNVYELIFEDGVLITTIDHSRAMQRIRKNIELGLRNLTKNRDLKCIERYMNTSFFGDYKPFFSNHKRLSYLKEMKKDYQNKSVSFL